MNHRLIIFVALLAALFFVAKACKTVSFCDDSFGNSCSPLNSGAAAAVVDEEEEVVLTFNSAINPVSEAAPVLAENKKKPKTKPAVGNVPLSDGRCLTSCAWFGEKTNDPKTPEQLCGDCAKRFIVYTPAELYNCYPFPISIQNGTIPLADVNLIKQGCANIAACTCRPGEVAQPEKVVLLLQALNTEIKTTFNEVSAISNQIRGEIYDASKKVATLVKDHGINGGKCLNFIDEALKNVTKAYEKNVESLYKEKEQMEKTIKDQKNWTDKIFDKKLNAIMKIKEKFVKLFKQKLVYVLQQISKCKTVIVRFEKQQAKKKKQEEEKKQKEKEKEEKEKQKLIKKQEKAAAAAQKKAEQAANKLNKTIKRK